jgi:hypothetical protein
MLYLVAPRYGTIWSRASFSWPITTTGLSSVEEGFEFAVDELIVVWSAWGVWLEDGLGEGDWIVCPIAATANRE